MKNRHNGVSFPILDEAEADDRLRLGKNRKDWKIYISMHLETGEIYQTSSIVAFNEATMQVTTNSGSIYKLENANKNSHIDLLKLYFKNDDYPAFDAGN